MLININQYQYMVTKIPITKARINLGGLIKKVHLDKKRFIIEKDGYPVAGIMDIDEFEDYLDSCDRAENKSIRKSYKEYKEGGAREAMDFLKTICKAKKA